MQKHFFILAILILTTFFSCNKSEKIPGIEWQNDVNKDESAHPIRFVFDTISLKLDCSKETTDGKLVRFYFRGRFLNQIWIIYPGENNDAVRKIVSVNYSEKGTIESMSEIFTSEDENFNACKEEQSYTRKFNKWQCLSGIETWKSGNLVKLFSVESLDFDFDYAFKQINESSIKRYDEDFNGSRVLLEKENTDTGALTITYDPGAECVDFQILNTETGMREWETVTRMRDYFHVRFDPVKHMLTAGYMKREYGGNHKFMSEFRIGKWYEFNGLFLLESVKNYKDSDAI